MGPDLGPVAASLAALAEADPAREVCGLVVRATDGTLEAWPLPNRSATPARAFEAAPEGVLQAMRRLDREGLSLLAVYHSHLSGGAGLSASDIASALVGGQPLLPGVAQVVVELRGGRAVRVRAHWLANGRLEACDLWPPGLGSSAPPL